MNKRVVILFLLLCLVGFHGLSQVGFSELEKDLIAGKEFDKNKYPSRHVVLGFGNQNKLLDYSLGGLMFVYQKYVSPQISAECLYSPSCSAYSKLLFRTYGPGKALLATIDRLMRCDRISATDIHPSEIDAHTHRKWEMPERYGEINPAK